MSLYTDAELESLLALLPDDVRESARAKTLAEQARIRAAIEAAKTHEPAHEAVPHEPAHVEPAAPAHGSGS